MSTVTIGLNGSCSDRNAGVRDINSVIVDYSCDYMQKKYSREFEATRTEKRMLLTDTVIVRMNPKDDKSLNFDITVNTEGEVTEQYVENLAVHNVNVNIQKAFASNGIDCAVNAETLSKKSVGETDINLTISDIMKKYNIERLFITAIFKMSDVKGKKETLVNIIKDYNKSENLNFGIIGYILEDRCFEACKIDCFEKWPSVSGDIIEKDYKAKAKFYVAIKDSVVIRENFNDEMRNI